MSDIMDEVFTVYTGQERIFTLNGKEIVIPAQMDTFLHYRDKFYELAQVCTQKAKEEYTSTVHDLDSFRENYPNIYTNNLSLISQKAIDILVSAGIYTYTADSFMKEYMVQIGYDKGFYAIMEESIRLTEEQNAKTSQGLMNGLTSLLGNRGGFFGSFVDGVKEGAVEEGTKLTEEQKKELFQRLKPHLVLNEMFTHFACVSVSLIGILRENGSDIWLPSGKIENLDAILQSISNSNFPEEKLTDTLIDLLLTDINESRVYEVMEKKFGLTEEVQAFFAYTMYPEHSSSSPYSAGDFPVPEAAEPDTDSETEQNGTQQTPPESEQPQKKGLFSFMDKMDGETVKKGLKIGAGIVAAGLAAKVLSGGSSNASNGGDNSDLIKSMQEENKKMLEENRRIENERRRQAAWDSQRQRDAVLKANAERRRKGQPELPVPPVNYW